MFILILGLLIFLGIHVLKLVAPDRRNELAARYGEGPYKGIYSLISAIGLILVIWGFARASADPVVVYAPPAGLRSITALLMPFALILAIASVLPTGRIKRAVRDPLMIGTLIFAIAHLLANGDLAGLVLFGALLVWAAIDLTAQPAGRPAPVLANSSLTSDLAAVVGGLVLYALLVWRLHYWLIGVSPLG